MTTKKQPIKLNITGEELRNICSQWALNDDCLLTDSDETYNIKKSMDKLDKSDFIIYCLYLELGTKSDVGRVLGISRISASRIIKEIEEQIKNNMEKNNEE